jgi:beta-glucosidase
MFCVIAALFVLCLSQTPEEIVANMTLEEKAGQMTQAERGSISNDDIKNYFIGSVLSGGGSVPSPNTPAGWVSMLNGFINASLQTRLKIPVIYGIDAVHGQNNIVNTTIFPHNVGYGATGVGNLTLGVANAEEEGKTVLKELRATGHVWTFAPVLGNPQDIHWGRTYEGYSENISIPAALGPAYIRGVQSGGNAVATMKHYLGEGQTTDGKNQGNAILTEAQIRELLLPYREAIAAGALTLVFFFSCLFFWYIYLDAII